MLTGTDGADEQNLLSQPFCQGCSQRQGLGAVPSSSGQEVDSPPAGRVMGWCQHPLAALHKDVQAMGLLMLTLGWRASGSGSSSHCPWDGI